MRAISAIPAGRIPCEPLKLHKTTPRQQAKIDLCLTCSLSECDHGDPGCSFNRNKNRKSRKQTPEVAARESEGNVTTTTKQVEVNPSILTLYFHETARGFVQQAAEINGVNIPLADFVPGAIYKRTGRPPMNYFLAGYGWVEFEKAVRR